jgi:uncharacterized protein YgfB (UPF0149 family)
MAYSACNAIFLRCDTDLSAAEAHGLATGMLCVSDQTESTYWLTELLQNANQTSSNDEDILIRLFEETRRLLASDEFDFDLFLPEDDVILTDRVEALTNWCRGFLFGVGSVATVTNWSKETREILKDITEFTKLDIEVEGEEDERDFVEITEFLRSAILLLRDALANNSDSSNDLWRDDHETN